MSLSNKFIKHRLSFQKSVLPFSRFPVKGTTDRRGIDGGYLTTIRYAGLSNIGFAMVVQDYEPSFVQKGVPHFSRFHVKRPMDRPSRLCWSETCRLFNIHPAPFSFRIRCKCIRCHLVFTRPIVCDDRVDCISSTSASTSVRQGEVILPLDL